MDIIAIQDNINRIEGVINTKIVFENDTINEVHILANNLRAPKQIVRDIESSLMASLDYRIDRKIISIAQIEIDKPKSFRDISYEGISINISGKMIECGVKLIYEEQEYMASNTTINTKENLKKIIATVTLKTISDILGQAYLFDLHDVLVNVSKDITIVTVVVNVIKEDRDNIAIGSVIVKNDINEAIALATLEAVNKVL